jgi:hypothetical protein
VTMTAPDPIPNTEWQQVATITVYGDPAGQGRVSFMGKGRPAIHSNAKHLKPWRKAIILAARQTTGAHGYTDWNGICLTCRIEKDQHGLYANTPTRADITITVPKPKTAPKRRRTWPITRSAPTSTTTPAPASTPSPNPA